MTPVDPKYVEKAHALSNTCQNWFVPGGYGHNDDCTDIARALQDADDAARKGARDEAESRCWKIADDLAVLFDERKDPVGCNAACQIRDRIAVARRGPG